MNCSCLSGVMQLEASVKELKSRAGEELGCSVPGEAAEGGSRAQGPQQDSFISGLQGSLSQVVAVIAGAIRLGQMDADSPLGYMLLGTTGLCTLWQQAGPWGSCSRMQQCCSRMCMP